jgi:hypothetical protein
LSTCHRSGDCRTACTGMSSGEGHTVNGCSMRNDIKHQKWFQKPS